MLMDTNTERHTMKNLLKWITRNYGNSVILLLFILFIWIGSTFKESQKELIKAEKTTEYKLKDGTAVASNKVQVVAEKEIKSIIKSKSKNVKQVANKFAKVKGITQTVNTINIDTINVVVSDTVKVNFEYKGSLLNEGYSFDYKVNQKGFIITNFTMIDTTTTIDGTKRKWFLGKETETTDSFHSNKNITTNTVESIKAEAKPPWYWSNVSKGVYLGILAGGIIQLSQ